MGQVKIQDFLFKAIKEKLPFDKSLADAISEALHVSQDSAYRRIRGETPLVLEEAGLLCAAFDISLDQLFKLDNHSIVFQTVSAGNGNGSFKSFLNSIRLQLEEISKADNKQIVYLTKEIVVFHQFLFKPLFVFQYLFWMRSFVDRQNKPLAFSLDVLPADIEALGKECARLYYSIPSIEIINVESINTTLSQIEYFQQTGLFETASDLEKVYASLRQMLEHLQHQAELGTKFLIEENPSVKKKNFQLFHNRINLADNTIMTVVNDKKRVYLNYDALDFMVTEDENFCNNINDKLQNLVKKSTLLSDYNEKQRNVFFNALLKKIPERSKSVINE